jgi:hypothetical protein
MHKMQRERDTWCVVVFSCIMHASCIVRRRGEKETKKLQTARKEVGKSSLAGWLSILQG